jgi:hypothetical protein
MTQEETKNLLQDCFNLKSCVSFYTCPHAPFYRETKGLLHSDTTLNSKNIPSVNTYTNVFYISYIYKPATSSHAKLRLFETTSLTLLLAWFVSLPVQEIFMYRDSQTRPPADSRISQIPDFMISQVHGFGSSRVRDFEASQVRDSGTSHVRDFEASHVHGFRSSRVRDFEAS